MELHWDGSTHTPEYVSVPLTVKRPEAMNALEMQQKLVQLQREVEELKEKMEEMRNYDCSCDGKCTSQDHCLKRTEAIRILQDPSQNYSRMFPYFGRTFDELLEEDGRTDEK